MAIFLDIGGEGKNERAINLNPSRVKTVGADRGQPIPRLVVGRADAIPFEDGSVERVIVERTPLSRAALSEIARVMEPSGVIVLRHAFFQGHDQHLLARSFFPGRLQQRLRRLRGRLVQESVFFLGHEEESCDRPDWQSVVASARSCEGT